MGDSIANFFRSIEVEVSTSTLILSIVLIALAIVLLLAGRKVKWNSRMLAHAAICVAVSFILSYFRLFHMPQGGSVTLASMLPIMGFAYAYGTIPGLLVGLAYGLLQLISDPYVVHPIQLILDYPLAFAVLALAGLGRKLPTPWGLPVGVLIGGLLRYTCHFVSGFVFFGEYADPGQSVYLYSLVYNSVIGIDTLICFVLSFIPQLQTLFLRMNTNQKAKIH